MQDFVDLVSSIVGGFQRTIIFLVLGALVLGVIITFGVTQTAPAVAESIGERAERFGDKAIERAAQEHRAAAMAEEGWGYSGGTAASATSTDPSSDPYASEGGGDWAD